MPLHLDQIAPGARLRYVDLGRQFGCADVAAQAEQTLAAAERFDTAIADHGFIREDVDRLRDALSLLTSKAQCANPERIKNKRTSQAYVEAMRAGKTARQRARSILHIVVQRLVTSGDPIESEAGRAVFATLQQTESSRGEPARLATQLDQLRAALSMPRVDRVAGPRGGPSTERELAVAAEALRLAAMIEPHRANSDAPSLSRRDPELEELDLLCGIIVELVRDARRAARSAARELRLPAIASAFELIKLYGPLGGGAADSERVPAPRGY